MQQGQQCDPDAQTTDQEVLQQEVTTIDSVAQFSSSDEATIDDNGLKDPDYDEVAKEPALVIRHQNSAPYDTLTPVRWGRHINWNQVVRNYRVVIVGDTVAFVTITKTIPGEFMVAFGSSTADSIV